MDGPLWCPTKVTTPSGSYEFPLKAGDYNFLNSAGFQYEAAAVRDCLKSGKTVIIYGRIHKPVVVQNIGVKDLVFFPF